MSTATIAAGNVRPLSAIKADMANRLAQQPQSLFADAKAALTWLPRKAYNAAIRSLRWLHVPQFLSFAQRSLSRFLGVVGKGPFAVEMLTSHWGQKTIVKGLEFGAKVVNLTVKTAWRIATSPLRLFTPTRNAVMKFETAVAKVNRKLTPNSGETFGPLQITRDIAGHFFSADRRHTRIVRTTAVAVMAVRVTRRFVPVGWMRILAYILDGLMIARSYDDVLAGTWIGRKLAFQAATIEADVKRQAETVGAEATRLTREAAADVAGKLRAEADQVEAETITAAAELRDSLIAEGVQKAQDMRHEAESLEQSAERVAAAEAASETATVTAVIDRPKPGPSVPPMGGRTPHSGPQSKPHEKRDKGRNR